MLPKNKLIYLIGGLGRRGFLNFVPDAMYVKMMYFLIMGEKLDLKNPKKFNEKIQYLKVNDHNLEYTNWVDKFKVKDLVKDRIGAEYVVPLYGCWDRADKIDFDKLPNAFVLKCNHDQGSVILVKNKNEIDRQTIIKQLNRQLKRNSYYGTREFPYKNIKPLIIAEKYLEENIIDYKFYCFSGKPLFLYVGQGLTSDHSLKIDFYDINWNKMPFYRTDYHRIGNIAKPIEFEKMKRIAEILSQDIPFVRIDLFEVGEKVYFSEYTLYPASGYMPFVPREYDEIVGRWLDLDIIKK